MLPKHCISCADALRVRIYIPFPSQGRIQRLTAEQCRTSTFHLSWQQTRTVQLQGTNVQMLAFWKYQKKKKIWKKKSLHFLLFTVYFAIMIIVLNGKKSTQP